MATTFKDYYATLGVPRTATEKEIRSAFRKLARKHHPDVNQGDASAEERFKEINEAHEVLGDPEKRKKYDELGPRWQEYEQWERAGRPGPNPFEARTAPRGEPFEYRTVSPDELEDLFGNSAPFSDFFEQFFGGGGGGGGGRDARGRSQTFRQRATPPARGQDVEGETDVTLEEAYSGTSRTIELTDGEGRSRRVEIKIPAGIHEGARVRASGQGGSGAGGGGAGDLFVKVHVRDHAGFTRHGSNVEARVQVPLAVAIAGGSVPVRTLRGTTVSLTIPAATQNGSRLRLRGLGMPHVRGEGAGDLIAVVDVRLPVPVPEELDSWAKHQQAEGASKE
ncbi:MAG: J domain-containing protein [Candidatus Dormibacteraeota bacterium]|nr:J domain-containing protein [Candidatus Dormibacteraeota bacterium]